MATDEVCRKILALCLLEPEFYYTVQSYLTADFFKGTQFLPIIYKLFRNYTDSFFVIPDKNTFTDFIKEQLTSYGKEDKMEALHPVLEELYGYKTDLTVAQAIPYYLRVVQNDQVKRNLQEGFIPALQDLLETGDSLTDYHALLTSLEQALVPVQKRTIQNTHFDLFDAAKVMEIAGKTLSPQRLRQIIPTPIPTINKHMDGGAMPGEIYFVLGSDKSGKTMFVVQWAFTAFKLGKRVLLVNTEMDDSRMVQRYLQFIFQKPVEYLREHWETLHEQYERDFIAKYAGLGLQNFMTYTIKNKERGMAEVYDFMYKERTIYGRDYDFVVIDYTDNLTKALAVRTHVGLGAELGYADMKEIAMTFNCAVVSPGQYSNEAIERMKRGEAVQSHMTTGSTKKKDHTDGTLMIWSTEEMQLRGEVHILLENARNGERVLAACHWNPKIGTFTE